MYTPPENRRIITRQHIHFTADREINLEAIDKKIRTMGFTYRSEYLTACLHITIGDTADVSSAAPPRRLHRRKDTKNDQH